MSDSISHSNGFIKLKEVMTLNEVWIRSADAIDYLSHDLNLPQHQVMLIEVV